MSLRSRIANVFRGDGDAYREEDFAEAQERFGVPVTEV